MSNSAGVEFLRRQLAAVETERKKVQEAAAKLPQLDAEVQAIKLLLSKYTGEVEPQYATTPQSALYSSDGPSISDLAYQALMEAGKPQNTEQLLSFLASHGKKTSSATLRSMIYGKAKRGKLFKTVHPGVYGLKEWQ